jgi:hypothetical protein
MRQLIACNDNMHAVTVLSKFGEPGGCLNIPVLMKMDIGGLREAGTEQYLRMSCGNYVVDSAEEDTSITNFTNKHHEFHEQASRISRTSITNFTNKHHEFHEQASRSITNFRFSQLNKNLLDDTECVALVEILHTHTHTYTERVCVCVCVCVCACVCVFQKPEISGAQFRGMERTSMSMPFVCP